MEETILWKAEKAELETSHLFKFMDWLEKKHKHKFVDYSALWKWSTNNIETFWTDIINYFSIDYDGKLHPIIEGDQMPDVQWFSNMKLNYTEHIFRNRQPDTTAIIFRNEHNKEQTYTWRELKNSVASFQNYLISNGIKKGDCCVAYLPNIPEAFICFLACSSLGVIWSSCSPDFGVNSVIDRFAQIKPKVFISADGYHYNGKVFSRTSESQAIKDQLATVQLHLHLDYLSDKPSVWTSVMETHQKHPIQFKRVPFSHPLWVLYSSGTTGVPKAITHSQGGILLEHLKYLYLQNDVRAGETYFWYSTTGWMMWNFANSALLADATIFIYDGSPTYPRFDILWQYAQDYKISHFGTSAPYLIACMKKDIQPIKTYDLSSMRSIGSTGAPLPPEAFEYVYQSISKKVWLCSMAGGTDVCTAFIGSYISAKVKKGKIQGRALGVDLHAYNDAGEKVVNRVGEMVIQKPMPSMPIYFWNDPKKKRYLSSYFEKFAGSWRHGDWISIDKEGQIVIYGRSDATLNRHGIRIGTSEIYRSTNKIQEVEDSLIINLELPNGQHFMPLFIKLNKGQKYDETLQQKINTQLRNDYSPRHVPDVIIVVNEIPYTLSGKKLETPVKKILMGMPINKAANEEATKNPEALHYFVRNREAILSKRKK